METSSFIEFFDHLMVKSYSEAICESIGSIMNIACGTRRVLYPDNYAKEIFLRFTCHLITSCPKISSRRNVFSNADLVADGASWEKMEERRRKRKGRGSRRRRGVRCLTRTQICPTPQQRQPTSTIMLMSMTYPDLYPDTATDNSTARNDQSANQM